MSIAIDGVEVIEGTAIVRILPRSDSHALLDVGACWVALQADSAVRSVAVVSVADDFSVSVDLDGSNDETIAPKALGLLKPFGIGLRGRVFDYGLQLLADADVVVGTSDVQIADTSVNRGDIAVHAQRLRGLLPNASVSLFALLGATSPMSGARAAKLGLIDEIVNPSDVERSLVGRVRRLSGS